MSARIFERGYNLVSSLLVLFTLSLSYFSVLQNRALQRQNQVVLP